MKNNNLIVILIVLMVISSGIIIFPTSQANNGLEDKTIFVYDPNIDNGGVVETEWEKDSNGYSYLALSFEAISSQGVGLRGFTRFFKLGTIIEEFSIAISNDLTKNFNSGNIYGKGQGYIFTNALPTFYYISCSGLEENNQYYIIIKWKQENGVLGIYRDTNKNNPDSTSYKWEGDNGWEESNYDFNLGIIQVCNSPPTKAAKPSGPNEGHIGKPYTFTTYANDPTGHNISYNWDFNGDFKVDLGSKLYPSGEEASAEYVWTKTGTYKIRVQAIDEFGASSGWSNYLTIEITDPGTNRIPDKSSKPGGLAKGYTNTEYKFTSRAFDPDGEKIKIGWDWNNDNSIDTWSDWIDNGGTSVEYHSWNSPGTYKIKTRAKDQSGKIGEWSETKEIEIIRGRTATTFYPEEYGQPYIYADTHLLDLYGSYFYPIAEENGAVGAFTVTKAILEPTQIYGDAKASGCQRLDFYVGREKTINIDAELLYTGSRLSFLGSHAYNSKIWMIDNVDNKYEEELNYPWEPDFILTKLIEYLFTLKFVYYYRTVVPHAVFDFGLRIIKIKEVTTVHFSTVWLFIIGQLIFFISQMPGYSDLNSHLMNLEENDGAEIKHIKFSHTFQPGEHSIWVGLQSHSQAAVLGESMSFAAGQVQSITLDNYAPPKNPTLNLPSKGYIGEDVKLEINCIDPNDDNIRFIIDWGDGNTETTDYYKSGEDVIIKHSYKNIGEYEIKVIAEDIDRLKSETVQKVNIEIIIDDVKPSVSITQPRGGLYIFGRHYLPHTMPFTVVLGKIDVKVYAEDFESGVKEVHFKINGDLKNVVDKAPYNWNWDLSSGKKTLTVTVYDNALNSNSKSVDVIYINP